MALFALSAVLLLLAALLLGQFWFKEQNAKRVALTRLGGGQMSDNLATGVSSRFNSLSKKSADSEMVEIFTQLGWRSSRKRALFFVAQVATPFVLGALVWLYQQLGSKGEEGDLMSWLMPLFAMGVGYLLPKRILASKARQRREQLGREVSTMIPLLRMLFEVGMTVEQACRVLAMSGKEILPELSKELDYVLQRTDAGLDLAQELGAVAHVMKVDEMTDTFTILQQLIVQGGGGMSSLLSLKELMDKRRNTALQEQVSKMSGKMSIVMMVFLFPALLIVLAGPGFVALIQALGDM